MTNQDEPATGRWDWERDESSRGGWWVINRENGWQMHRYWTPNAFSAVQWLLAALNERVTLRADLDRALEASSIAETGRLEAIRELEDFAKGAEAMPMLWKVRQLKAEVEALRAYKGLLREFMEHRPQSSAELADWFSRVASALTETQKETQG